MLFETHAQGKQVRGSNGERERGKKEIPVVLIGFEGAWQRNAGTPQNEKGGDVCTSTRTHTQDAGGVREAGDGSIRGEAKGKECPAKGLTKQRQRTRKKAEKRRKHEFRRARQRHPAAATTTAAMKTHTSTEKQNVVVGGMSGEIKQKERRLHSSLYPLSLRQGSRETSSCEADAKTVDTEEEQKQNKKKTKKVSATQAEKCTASVYARSLQCFA